MMWPAKRTGSRPLLGVLLGVAACARGPIGGDADATSQQDDADEAGAADDDDDASSSGATVPTCEGPYCSDPANCGGPDIECRGWIGNPGECHDGRCARLSYCAGLTFDPPPGLTCSQLCGYSYPDGRCLAHGCSGQTAQAWVHYALCEDNALGQVGVDIGCDEPIDFSDPDTSFVRCCCFEP